MSSRPQVRIRYHRPPDRVQIFEQTVLERRNDCVVTFLERTPDRAPLVIGGRAVLERGSPIIWFTFPYAWHDIGRFYLADGSFTGVYANILTPVSSIESSEWETTDLILDVWLDRLGGVSVLDVDELNRVHAAGWLEHALVKRARREAARLVWLAQGRDWPPVIVGDWTLERARAVLRP